MEKIHAYILDLEEPLGINELKPLINRRFKILNESISWGEMIVDTDELLVTNIKFMIDVGTGKNECTIMIYSDYFLKGNKNYNAWTSLDGIKASIKRYLEREAKQTVSDLG